MATRVTIQDIASELQLSRNTVSKAINNTGVLTNATQEKILHKTADGAADELHGADRGRVEAEGAVEQQHDAELHRAHAHLDRDDLPDFGSAHYAACIRAIHERMPDTAVEALTPDFQGQHDLVAQVLDAGLATYAQNLETVRRLTHPVRDPRAGNEQTLDVLKFAKS